MNLLIALIICHFILLGGIVIIQTCCILYEWIIRTKVKEANVILGGSEMEIDLDEG
jgi:hypothetical protein